MQKPANRVCALIVTLLLASAGCSHAPSVPSPGDSTDATSATDLVLVDALVDSNEPKPLADTTASAATDVGDAAPAPDTDAAAAAPADVTADVVPACLPPAATCASAAACCSGICAVDLGVCLAGTCGVSGAACSASTQCCSESCIAGSCAAEHVLTTDRNRDRLLDTLTHIQGASDRCSYWTTLTANQMGIFLTHTDMLGNRSCMDQAALTSGYLDANGKCPAGNTCQCAVGSDMALDHVHELWTLNGSDPTCACTETPTGFGCCNGGVEWHRMFFTADDALITALRTLAGSLPAWGPSTDPGGPHAPFDSSTETFAGQPRGQTQFWAYDAEATVLGARPA